MNLATATSFITGKHYYVDMILSPSKQAVAKRKLNFSDGPDASSTEPSKKTRRRKLIKVVTNAMQLAKHTYLYILDKINTGP